MFLHYISYWLLMGEFVHCPKSATEFTTRRNHEGSLQKGCTMVGRHSERLVFHGKNICNEQVAYANAVTKPGFYLGVLDIALLARRRDKDILVLYYDDEFADTPVVKNLSEILGAIFPDAEVQGQNAKPQPGDTSTWCLASLMANYDRGSFRQLNHFHCFPSLQWDMLCGKLWLRKAGTRWPSESEPWKRT